MVTLNYEESDKAYYLDRIRKIDTQLSNLYVRKWKILNKMKERRLD